MSNETRHYFGAYIEIKTNKIKTKEIFHACEDGHRSFSKFCPDCGKPVEMVEKTREGFPTQVNNILDDELRDVLYTITPPSLYGSGIIIAIGNTSKPRGEWLYLTRWGNDVEIKNFPTDAEVEQMINELELNYKNEITALRNSSDVSQVTVKAGYVFDIDF